MVKRAFTLHKSDSALLPHETQNMKQYLADIGPIEFLSKAQDREIGECLCSHRTACRQLILSSLFGAEKACASIKIATMKKKKDEGEQSMFHTDQHGNSADEIRERLPICIPEIEKLLESKKLQNSFKNVMSATTIKTRQNSEKKRDIYMKPVLALFQKLPLRMWVLEKILEEGKELLTKSHYAITKIAKEKRSAFAERMEKIEEHRDRYYETQNELVSANLPLAVNVAKQYRDRGISFMDLVQFGNGGLIHAAEKFEPERNIKFSTYATWWVHQYIRSALKNKGRLVRIPIHIQERSYKNGNSEQQLPFTVSLDHLMSKEDSEESSFLPKGMAIEENPLEKKEELELQTTLEKALKVLDPRAREIIKARFGFGDEEPKALAEIGIVHGLTKERVRQIIEQSTNRLQKYYGEKLAVFLQ